MGILGNLLLRLKEGEVTFEYKKSNGNLRRARGTLNKERIPREDWNTVQKPNKVNDEFSARRSSYLSYYDLDAGEWRRFKIFSLLKIVSFKTMDSIKQVRRNYKDIEDEDF